MDKRCGTLNYIDHLVFWSWGGGRGPGTPREPICVAIPAVDGRGLFRSHFRLFPIPLHFNPSTPFPAFPPPPHCNSILSRTGPASPARAGGRDGVGGGRGMGDPTKGRLTSLPPGEAARLLQDIQGCTRIPFCSLKILDDIF